MDASHYTRDSSVSTDEGYMAESFVEDLSPEADANESYCSFIGELWFRFALGQLASSSIDINYGEGDLKSTLHTKLQVYPYAKSLQQIQEKIPAWSSLGPSSCDEDPKSIFFTCLGQILRQGDSEARKSMLSVVRRCNKKDLGPLPQVSPRSGRMESAAPGEPRTRPLAASLVIPDGPLGSYAVTLKEYGDSVGQTYKPQVRRTQVEPPLFEATLHFSGETFIQHGRSQQIAKHRAAFAACHHLGLGATDE